MGFYDFRCAITGISLKGSDAVLVGLQPVGGGYRPITLGITGAYNRLGSIDDIAEDRNTELVLAYFHDRARTADLVLDPDYAEEYGDPPGDIECLLNYLERNVSDSSEEYPAATLFGQRIFSALVAKPVWTALATADPRDDNPEISFKQAFGDSVIAGEIYRDRIREVARHVHELAAVNHFLAARNSAWAPDEEIGSQHDAEEMRQFLEAARLTFRDTPAVLTALDEYAEQAADLLNDD